MSKFVEIIKKLLSDKRFFILELGFIGLVAYDKQFWSHQYYQLRIYLCIIVLFYIIFASKIIGLSKKKLGLIATNWLVSLKQSFLPVLILFISLILLKLFWPSLFALGIYYNSVNQVIYRLLAYVVISVPVQELIFRAYVVNRLEQFTNNKHFIVITSAIIFSSIHWPFRSLLLTLGSFIFGLFLTNNFIKYRNLYSLIAIHSILGVIVTLITIET